MSENVFEAAKQAQQAAREKLDSDRDSYMASVRAYYGLKGWSGAVERYGPTALKVATAAAGGAGLTEIIGPIRQALGL